MIRGLIRRITLLNRITKTKMIDTVIITTREFFIRELGRFGEDNRCWKSVCPQIPTRAKRTIKYKSLDFGGSHSGGAPDCDPLL